MNIEDISKYVSPADCELSLSNMKDILNTTLQNMTKRKRLEILTHVVVLCEKDLDKCEITVNRPPKERLEEGLDRVIHSPGDITHCQILLRWKLYNEEPEEDQIKKDKVLECIVYLLTYTGVDQKDIPKLAKTILQTCIDLGTLKLKGQ